MEEYITTHVGLDVHKDTVAIAVAGPVPGGARFVGTVGSQVGELLKALGKLGDSKAIQVVYEAGPCGYSLVRRLRSEGYCCDLIAPAKVARRAGDRIKTDRRDALHLAEQARAGALTSVWVLEEEDEAIRDLSRAREDAVRAGLKARQRLSAMLLRHGRSYSGKTRWTPAHERYLAQLSFGYPAQDLAYAEYRAAGQYGSVYSNVFDDGRRMAMIVEVERQVGTRHVDDGFGGTLERGVYQTYSHVAIFDVQSGELLSKTPVGTEIESDYCTNIEIAYE